MSNSLAIRRASWQQNALFGYALQTANYVLPILTLPFLIRTLGTETYGTLAYAYATVMFVVLLVDAGVDTLATRRLSTAKNTAEVSLHFAAVTWLKFGVATAVAAPALLLLKLLPSPNSALLAVNFLLVAGSLTFPVWLFRGLEQMHFVTLCGVIGRLLCTIALFSLVRGPDDLLLAAGLQAGATLLAGCIALPLLRWHLKLRLIHPAAQLWEVIRTIASEAKMLAAAEFLERASANSTVFLLGLITSPHIVGVYAAIEKLAKAAVSLFQPLLRALFPVLCRTWLENPSHALKIWRWIVLLTLVCATVGFSIAAAFGGWLLERVFGVGWDSEVPLLLVFCVWILFALLSVVCGLLGLIAAGHRSIYSQIAISTTLVQITLIVFGAAAADAIGMAVALTCSEGLRCAALIYAARSNLTI